MLMFIPDFRRIEGGCIEMDIFPDFLNFSERVSPKDSRASGSLYYFLEWNFDYLWCSITVLGGMKRCGISSLFR